uniref:Uncharacterized protein LOC104249244 n=1 Tax=Nicotiana sylvestris TaxID=4096 RepID=A0A1U7YPL4_NICSY|nr:PREDICTED: uncharacterized protein LOC104249244 [Nicotiana sylvestris]
MEESTKKRMDKGKAKVAEPIEAFDVDEMDPVHQGEHVTVKVQTPKPKNTKTSPKKSSSVSKTAEPSLAKRTRSDVKAKKVKITKEEDWSGKVLLVDALDVQGWKAMDLQLDGRLDRNEIIEFMENAKVKDGRVTSQVKGVQVSFDAKRLGEILGIPSEGYDDYTRQKWLSLDSLPTTLAITRKLCDVTEVNEAKVVYKSEMKLSHKVLFEFVNKCLLPRQERRHIANYMDLILMECLESGWQINWLGFMIKLLDRVINGSKAHATPYGFILTIVPARCKMPLKKWEMAASKDHFGINTLIACDYEVNSNPNEPGSSKKTPINSKVIALLQESEAKDAEIARLKNLLAEVESERDALKTELTKEKEKNNGIL